MFRTRTRTETPSRTGRGSVGSARVWDEGTRRRGGRPDPAAARVAAAPDADELLALVGGIVQATLDTQLADCEPTRRGAIARVLEARLLALLGVAAAPDLAREEDEEPAAPGSSGPEPASEPEIVYPPAQRALGLVLEDRLQRLGGPLAERADLRRRLVALALGFLPAAAPASGVAVNGHGATVEDLRELDRLQRRAVKLEQALREARAALDYVAGLEHVDQGLASIYRVVQGLALDDPQRERKQGALEAIFRANLELQRKG